MQKPPGADTGVKIADYFRNHGGGKNGFDKRQYLKGSEADGPGVVWGCIKMVSLS
jgi:hypothetical protein